VLTTHYLDEAERLCDRIAVMHLGRIVALDTPEALRASLGRELVELRVENGDGPAALRTLRDRGIAGGDSFTVGSTVTVPLRDRTAADAVAAIGALDLAPAEIRTRRPTLDDVYLRLTGGPSGRGHLKGDPDVHPHTRADPRAAAADAQPARAAPHPRTATLPAHGPHPA
jgi:ABC-type multidrug transport system ATPase subunit